MVRHLPFPVKHGPVWMLVTLLFMVTVAPVWCLELPKDLLSALQSDQFRTREDAQTKLLAWARQQPQPAMDVLYRVSRTHGEPEVRERCLSVLRELVNDEYLKEGEGFLGIQMLEEKALVPDEAKPRSVIRVTHLVPDSAAQKAGVKLNDLITGLDDKKWQDDTVLQPFMNHVRQVKPGNAVILRILRNGEMINLEVKLGRRPLLADNPFLDQRQVDIEAAERAAKDAYFRRWLERSKAND